MNRFLRCIAILLVVLTLFSSMGTVGAVPDDSSASSTVPSATDENTAGNTNTEDTADSDSDSDAAFSKFKYSDYLEKYSDAPKANKEVVWGASQNIIAKSDDVKVYTEVDASLPEEAKQFAGMSIYTTESSFVEWTVTVPETAMYTLNILYYNVEGKDSEIERTILIDGKTPFTEALAAIFPRVWRDVVSEDAKELTDDEIKAGYASFVRDVHDNDIRNESEEIRLWSYIDCRDNSGLYEDPFTFYLTAGTHTIRFKSQREPICINSLKLYTPDTLITYDELCAEYDKKGYKPGNAASLRVQAENMSSKSSATIYAEYDRGSSKMEPYSYDVIRLNQISSDKFTTPYQWVEWTFDVEEAGLYEIVTRFNQSARDGAFCNRTIYVNGEIPCQEAKHIRFNYDDSWQVSTIATSTGETMKFYLDKGVNTIRLEVTLGELSPIVDRVDTAIFDLNECYRKILMITGSTPDTYRDYQFPKIIPDVLELMETSGESLKKVVEDIQELTGEEKGSFTSSFITLTNDIDTMTKNPRTIAKRLSNFKANLGTISTWILNATSQPVGFDWIEIAPYNEERKLEKAENGFFKDMWHQVMMFIASFYMDYDDVGRRPTTNENATRDITVWVTTSLDQSQILRRLIDNNLSQNSDLKVDLKLVSATTVLPSIAAGQGPDVILGVGNSEPINYAIRGAVINLDDRNVNTKENYDEVMGRFADVAIIPYQYQDPKTKQTSTYGIPETYAFSMLFYRKDILAELDMKVPRTWKEVYDCIVKLNMNSMTFGVTATMDTYAALLYQQGGAFYRRTDEGLYESALDTPVAIKCFEQWTEFFSAYGSPITFDFSNRFRTGEMPMGIAGYSTYNQLSVFATEIKGLWGFEIMPGTEKVDENGNTYIDSTTMGSGTASIVLATTKDAKASWDFLDWWTSDDIQVAYGLEMESILGTAARYATANKNALARLPWSTEDFNKISEQWDKTSALPEVPGSYMLSRYVNFAFLAVANEGKEPGEELLDYIVMINDELDRKQREFIKE